MIQVLTVFESVGFSIMLGIYGTIARLYDQMLNLTQYNPEEYEKILVSIESVASTFYVLAGVFMLFRVTIAMINMLIDPDKLGDRQAGAGKILVRVVTSLLMLIMFVPNGWVFDKNDGILARVERGVLGENGIIDSFFPTINEGVSGKPRTILSDDVYAADEPLDCYYAVRKYMTDKALAEMGDKTKYATYVFDTDKGFIHIKFYKQPKSSTGKSELCTNTDSNGKDCNKYSFEIVKDSNGLYNDLLTVHGKTNKVIGTMYKNAAPSTCPNYLENKNAYYETINSKSSWKDYTPTFQGAGLGYLVVGGWSSESDMISAIKNAGGTLIGNNAATYSEKTGIQTNDQKNKIDDDKTSPGKTTTDQEKQKEKGNSQIEVANDAALTFAQHAMGTFITCTAEDDAGKQECEELLYGKGGDPRTGMIANREANNKIKDYLTDSWYEIGNDKIFAMDYILGILVGVALFVWIVVLCVDVIIRRFKLLLLEMIAPIPIISYSDPNDKIFKDWGSMYITTYVDLFIKLFSVGLAIRLLDAVYVSYKDADGLLKLFFIVAVLVFAKVIPDMISNIFHIKVGSGTFKDILGMGKAVLGTGAGAALGGAVGFATGKGVRGRLAGLAQGTLMGAGSGSKGKITGGAKAAAATNAMRKQGLSFFDRLQYAGLGALGIDPNISRRHDLEQTKQAENQIETIQGHIKSMDDSIDRTPEVAAFMRSIANETIKDPTGNKAKMIREAFAAAYEDGKKKSITFRDLENTATYQKLLDEDPDKAILLANDFESDYNKLYGKDASLTVSQGAWGEGFRTSKSAWLNGMNLLKRDKETVQIIRNLAANKAISQGDVEKLLGEYSMDTAYTEIAGGIKGATFGTQRELKNTMAEQTQDLEYHEKRSKIGK